MKDLKLVKEIPVIVNGEKLIEQHITFKSEHPIIYLKDITGGSVKPEDNATK